MSKPETPPHDELADQPVNDQPESSQADVVDDRKRMDVHSGVRWSAMAQYGTQAIQFISTMVVARLVAPESYGLIAMAMVVTGLVDMFRTLGFGPAIIQKKQLSEELLSSLFFFIMAFSCILAIVIAGSAPLFSWLYGDARVGLIIAVLSITFVISSVRRVQSSLLTRQMAFDRLAIVDCLVALSSAVVAILLAYIGWEVWALVWSAIVGSVVRAILLWNSCSWRPRLIFCWAEIRTVLSFGLNLTGYHLFTYSIRNTDKFVVGAFLGAAATGFYSVAIQFLKLPIDATCQILGRVLFPAFAGMQGDDVRLKSAYLRACGAIAFITFPMMLGMLVVATPFIEVVLGAKWLPSAPILMLLAPLGMVQSIDATLPYILQAKGRADWLLRWSIVSGALTAAGIVAGLPWGIQGVAAAYAITSSMIMTVGCSVAFRLVDGLRVRDLLIALWPHLACSGAMAVLVLGCRIAMEKGEMEAALTLPVCVALGILSYGAIVLSVRPPAVDDCLRMLPQKYLSFVPRFAKTRAS